MGRKESNQTNDLIEVFGVWDLVKEYIGFRTKNKNL